MKKCCDNPELELDGGFRDYWIGVRCRNCLTVSGSIRNTQPSNWLTTGIHYLRLARKWRVAIRREQKSKRAVANRQFLEALIAGKPAKK